MRKQRYPPTFGTPSELKTIKAPTELTIELPAYQEENGSLGAGYPFELTADFMNSLNGGLEKDHWMNVVLKLDLDAAEKIGGQEPADTTAATETTAAVETTVPQLDGFGQV